MWQQAALPHPPLPVSHDRLDDTHWQGWEMAAKETPRWTPPTHTHMHAHTQSKPHTHKHTHPRLQGFAINPNMGEDNKGGDEGDAVEMQKSGTGYRSKSNIKTKAHTSPISY